MNHPADAIDAIFLDLGNTLRLLVKDDQHQANARQRIATLVGTQESPAVFCAELDKRYKVYKQRALDTWIEAPEKDLWTRWLLPEFPAEVIGPLAEELTYQYRRSAGRRVLIEDGKQVVMELSRRGYTLGIISNLIGTREIPEWLIADDLAKYFKSVVLSSVLGIRKPDPSIFLEAARRAGVDPARSAYVGDNPHRDVVGARQAGFGMTILLLDSGEPGSAPPTGENVPDLTIYKLSSLLDHFPGR